MGDDIQGILCELKVHFKQMDKNHEEIVRSLMV
jgi:hypothetical protein